MPLGLNEMVIQGTELLAVHAQPLAALTCTDRNADADVNDTDVVDSTTAHVGAAWATVKTRPPTVSVPVRAAFVVFAATEYPTVPFPTPLAPLVTDSHEDDVVADHEQVAPVVTPTEPLDASAFADTAAGEIATSQVPA